MEPAPRGLIIFALIVLAGCVASMALDVVKPSWPNALLCVLLWTSIVNAVTQRVATRRKSTGAPNG